jgi:hypothetical protein
VVATGSAPVVRTRIVVPFRTNVPFVVKVAALAAHIECSICGQSRSTSSPY